MVSIPIFPAHYPSAIEYRVTNEQEKEISLQALQEACDEQEYEVYETIILKVKATSDRLPTEYSISEDKGRYSRI